MGLLYGLGIRLYGLAIWLAHFFNPKAKQWIEGRKDWRKMLARRPDLKNYIWIHCASLGEFEQGRPIIESIMQDHPESKILLTFYSPSGYEIRKNYELADFVCYLPIDTRSNAKDFIELTEPKMAIFVKYEVWHNFYRALHKRNIPTFMVSAIFRESQIYFKPWGKWFRKSLKRCAHIFTQDEPSTDLLNSIGIQSVTTAGDTRFDRVMTIAQQSKSDEKLAAFSEGNFTLIVGSSWPEDEAVFMDFVNSNPNVKAIIAPHEIHEKRISEILNTNPNACRWTDENSPSEDAQIMVLDTMGMLSAVYKYGSVAMIGGGFGKGIHNTLEAAVYGIPVCFGPNYQKFKEAKDLVACGGGIKLNSKADFESMMNEFLQSESACKEAGAAAKKYVDSNLGATQVILRNLPIASN